MHSQERSLLSLNVLRAAHVSDLMSFRRIMARLWSIRESSEKLASFSGEAGKASFSELFRAQQTLIS